MYVFGKIPRFVSGASLLSFSLLLRPIIKFHRVRTSLMRNFALCFSKRWSSIFLDTCLTLRRLCESYSSIWPQNFLHRISPRLCASLRFQRFLSPARHNPIVVQSSQKPKLLSIRFLYLSENGSFFLLFIWTLISGFSVRFCFVELTFGRMPILTKRCCATTFQIVSAPLLKNHASISFAFYTPCSRQYFYLVSLMAHKVW